MEDLAGLGVARGIERVGLGRGQVTEHAAREVRVNPQRLQRGNDAVAPERRAEPRHTRVRIVAVRGRARQHAQVGRRTPHPLIEPLARGFNHRVVGPRAFERLGRGAHRRFERARGDTAAFALTANGQRQRRRRLRRQIVFEAHDTAGHRRGRLAETDRRPAILAVQTTVAEPQLLIGGNRVEPRAAPLAAGAAHFEDVGKIGVDVEGERDPDVRAAVVQQPDALVTRAVPQEARPKQVHNVARKHHIGLAERHVRIGEIRAEQLVVFLDARAEQQRPHAVQPQPESGHVTGAFVIQALLAGAKDADVAVQVEHRERVAVLKDCRALANARRSGQDVELVLDLNHVFHATSPSTPTLFTALDCARS